MWSHQRRAVLISMLLMPLGACGFISSLKQQSRKRPIICAPLKAYRKKVYEQLEQASSFTSDDSWEKWEFGDERFIDKAMKEEAERTERALDHDDESGAIPPSSPPGHTPFRDGVAAYGEAAAALRPFVSEERLEKMEAVLGARSGHVRFVIEDPINPSNAWACLRTLDSFGVQYVDVITDPASYVNQDANPRLKRMNTAMGTQKWLDLQEHTSTEACVSQLKSQGWTIVATDLSEGAVALDDLDLDALGPFAVVMGNEERGISPAMRALADHKVYLPMRGFAQSFSLSVGCAAIASHLDTRGALQPGSLSPAERDRVAFSWYLATVRGGRSILRRLGFDIPKQAQRVRILDFKTK